MISAPGISRLVWFDGSLGKGNDTIEDVGFPRLSLSGFATERMQRRPILGDTADDEVGSPDINPENVSHAIPPNR